LLAHAQGDYEAARALYVESLALTRDIGQRWLLVPPLVGLAGVAVSHNHNAALAAQLAGAAEALRVALGMALGTAERGVWEATLAAAKETLG
jgi:hypothetical protein